MNIATVDHLVYATPDLAWGVEQVAELLGIRATPGGQHPGRGTRNALVSLGPKSYLEIVGPDSEQPPPARPRWFKIDELQRPRLVTWATPVGDIHAVVSRAAAAGLPLGAVGEGRRTRGDGATLAWRFTDPAVLVFDGVVPFLIDWGESPHPAATAPSGGELIRLRGEHPNDAAVERGLSALNIDMPVDRGDAPQLVATIRTATGEVELR